jgi:predicted signal transduction protein with EAL and GGDEF domain
VSSYEFPGVGHVTVSIGYTRISDPSTPTAILIDRADRAVYYSKRNGRNRVSGWEFLVEAGELPPTGPVKSDVTLF